MPTTKVHIKKGDEVQVIAGKDRSRRDRPRRGKVILVEPKTGRVRVDGINMIRRAVRQSQKIRQGGIIESPGPLHASNVMLVCPNCSAPTRIRRRVRDDGKRVRVCRRCGKDVDTD